MWKWLIGGVLLAALVVVTFAVVTDWPEGNNCCVVDGLTDAVSST